MIGRLRIPQSVENAEECRQTRALIGSPSDGKAISKWFMTSRQALKTLVGIFTDHCGLICILQEVVIVRYVYNGGENILSCIRSLPPLVVNQEASTLFCEEVSSLEWKRIIGFVRKTGRLLKVKNGKMGTDGQTEMAKKTLMLTRRTQPDAYSAAPLALLLLLLLINPNTKVFVQINANRFCQALDIAYAVADEKNEDIIIAS